jgi:hypothetical protein
MSARLKFALAILAFLPACSALNPTPFETAVYPAADAPVVVTVSSSAEFIVANHTEAPIYTQIFAAELLPLIDWAPCTSVETCLDRQILPGAERTFQFGAIVGAQTESIAVFWWQLEGDRGQPDSEYFFPQLIEFPVP